MNRRRPCAERHLTVKSCRVYRLFKFLAPKFYCFLEPPGDFGRMLFLYQNFHFRSSIFISEGKNTFNRLNYLGIVVEVLYQFILKLKVR